MNSDVLEFLERYSITIGNTSYPPILFIWVLFFLFIVFAIRMIAWIKIDKRTMKKRNIWYILGHQSLCYLFSVIISFSLTCIFENNHNILLNYVICPIIGFLLSFFFDSKVLLPVDKMYGLDRNKKSSPASNSSEQNIAININQNSSNTNNSGSHHLNNTKSLDDYIQMPKEKDYLTDEDMESDDHNTLLKNKINDLIDARYIKANEIKKIYNELTNQTNILDAMRETMKDDKKLKLEKMIYDCLNQGYATPEQNKIITTDYRNYTSLQGNGDIQELYENHYLKLEVHEDRRKNNRINPYNAIPILPGEVIYRTQIDNGFYQNNDIQNY